MANRGGGQHNRRLERTPENTTNVSRRALKREVRLLLFIVLYEYNQSNKYGYNDPKVRQQISMYIIVIFYSFLLQAFLST